MSKALTPLNQNDKGEIGCIAERFSARAQCADSPSYFGNFGIFNPFLMVCAEARHSKAHLGQKREFPVLTAFMAIV